MPIRRIFFRIVRWTALGAGVLTALVLLATAGVLFFLRTEAGEARLKATLTDVLEQAGIKASLGELKGPLPNRFVLRDVVLSDAHGPWLRVPEFTLRLNTAALLRRKLVVRELTVLHPELMRLPDLPPSAEPEPESGPSDPLAFTRGLPAWLPSVEVHTLLLRHIQLGPGIPGGPLIATVRGSARASSDTPLATRLQVDAGSAPEAVQDTLRLDLRLSPEEILDLHLTFEEQNGGLLEQRGLPAAPGFSLEGRAPLRNWTGSLSADLAAMLQVQGNLLWKLSPENGTVAVNVQAEPLSHAPDAWRAALGDRLSLGLDLAWGSGRFTVDSLDASTSAWQVRAEKLGLQDGAEMSPNLSGRLIVRVSDPDKLQAVAALPFASLGLQVELGGSLDEPAADLSLDVLRPAFFGSGADAPVRTVRQDEESALRARLNVKTEKRSVGAASTLAFTAQGRFNLEGVPGLRTAEADLRLEGEHSGEELTVRLLEIDSPLLHTRGEGVWSPHPEKVAARLQADIPELEAVTPLLGLADMAGRASLLFSLTQGKDAAATGSIRLNLAEMSWGTEQLDTLLGPEVRLSVDGGATWPSSAPVASGTPPEEPSKAGQLPDIHINQLLLDSSGLHARGKAVVQAGRLNASLETKVNDVAAVAASLRGELQLRLRAEGPASAPAVTAELLSPVLRINGEEVRDLRFWAQTGSVSASPFSAEGTLRVGAVADGAEQRLAAQWAVNEQEARLEALQGRLVGVELHGNIKALLSGPRLSGHLKARVADWKALSHLAPVTGKEADLEVRFEPDEGQRIVAGWSVAGLHAAGKAHLNSLKGEIQVADAFGTPRFSLSTVFGGGNVGGAGWKDGRIRVQGTQEKAALEADLNGAASGRLRAVWSDSVLRVSQLRFRDAAGGQGGELARPAEIEVRDGLGFRNVDLRLLPAGNLKLDGSLNSRALALTARLERVPLGLLRRFSAAPIPDGTLGVAAALHGTPQRPKGEFTLNLDDVAYPGSSFPPAALAIRGKVETGRNGSVLSAVLTASGLDARRAEGALQLPLSFSSDGVPAPALSRPLHGELHWDGPLAPLWRFVPLADRRLNGQGALDVAVSGSLDVPKVQARARVRDGRYDDLAVGLMLDDIELDADVQPFGSSALSLKAGDGRGGTLSLQGTIGSFKDGMPLDARGRLVDLKPLRRNDLRIRLSGDVNVAGPAPAPHVQADITVSEGELLLTQLPGGGITVLDVVNADTLSGQAALTSPASPDSETAVPLATGKLDVTVTVPNRFFVRGHGIESEWKGRLAVTGPFDAPSVVGDLRSVRGSIALLGKDFRLTKGVVSFEGGVMPFLDVVVTYVSSALTAEVTISGPAEHPSLHLSSQPNLPQDEIVAQVLFGRSSSGLSKLQALQAAAALSSLAGFGSGGQGLLDLTRGFLGVDVLRFGSAEGPQTAQKRSDPFAGPSGTADGNGDDEAAPTLEVGKYVLDNVYVGLEQGIGPDTGGVRVEVELGPHTNLEAKTTDRASEVGVNWKWDY